jgi:protein-S-isoprenylcysteine O-methyltransferase Ste14
MTVRDFAAAALFSIVYGLRLLYQWYLLRRRDTSGTKGERSELLLVIIPKNILVVLAIVYLAAGVHWGGLFFAGWAVFLVGIALRLAALHQLGAMYSLNVDIRPQHQLVTGGVYSIVRHPLYVAYVIDTLGIVVFLQHWYFWPVVATSIVGWAIRVPGEDRALAEIFGAEYDDYRIRVPGVNILLGVSRWARRAWRERATDQLHVDSVEVLPQRDTDGPSRTSPLSDAEKREIDIHLTEYKALSDFQRDAKATFVRIAIYHNTGIAIAVTWTLQNYSAPDGVVATLLRSGYFYPVLFALPIFNSVLIVASAYQAYSFFCVALHFAHMRRRLTDLVGYDVFAYEDKFGRLLGPQRQLSMLLDVAAAAMWFMIPVLLAATIALMGPSAAGPINRRLSMWAYWVGTGCSSAAVLYLVGLVTLMRQIGRRATEQFRDRAASAGR